MLGCNTNDASIGLYFNGSQDPYKQRHNKQFEVLLSRKIIYFKQLMN